MQACFEALYPPTPFMQRESHMLGPVVSVCEKGGPHSRTDELHLDYHPLLPRRGRRGTCQASKIIGHCPSVVRTNGQRRVPQRAGRCVPHRARPFYEADFTTGAPHPS